MAVSPVILAGFSDLAGRGERIVLDRLQRKALIAACAIGIPALLLVSGRGAAILQLFLGHGRFDAATAERVAGHWSVLTWGFGITVYGNVLAKRIQAEKGAKWLSLFAAAGLGVLYCAERLFHGRLGELAVPAAITVQMAATALLMAAFLALRRHAQTWRRPMRERRAP